MSGSLNTEIPTLAAITSAVTKARMMGCGMLLAVAGSAQAITLDFEDLNGYGVLPSDYAGLTWDSNWQYYDWSQAPYYASSGEVRIYTHSYGGWIDFGQEVNFLGSWVATANVGQEVFWEGYRDGVKLFESAHLPGGSQAWITVDWRDVDYVRFVSTSYNYFVIDDISYNVPEPSGLALMASGLALAGFVRRARHRRTSAS